MTNADLLDAMRRNGNLIVAHIGDELPKRYKNDKPGSPQTLIELMTADGKKTSVLVCEGEDRKSFRIVLDDAIHKIPKGSTLEDAVKVQQATSRRLLWPENPELWIREKKSIILKSRRFAMVFGNELHIRKYEDPAHGWLAVPMQWIEALSIAEQISRHSYQRGGTAYLEEDCDAPRFRRAAESAGFRLFVHYRHIDKRSPIRSYDSFEGQ